MWKTKGYLGDLRRLMCVENGDGRDTDFFNGYALEVRHRMFMKI